MTWRPTSIRRGGALKEVLGTRLRYSVITGFQISGPASPLPEPSRYTPVEGTGSLGRRCPEVVARLRSFLLLMNGFLVLSMEIIATPAISGV